MKNLTYTIALLCCVGLLSAQQATLHPTTFTSQGVLRDAAGRSLADDTYEMIFEIFANVNGNGNPLWTETADVLVTNGVWTYTFGSSSSNPLEDLNQNANYMKITVNGDALSPLTRISLSAMETLNVSGGGNLIPASGNLGIGTTSPGEKLDVVGNIELNGNLKMKPGVSGTKIADTFEGNTSKTRIDFVKMSGSNDPGAIIHETRGSGGENNEGVLHLMPSDDNAYGDYVSIHGTVSSDKMKLHTDGTIEGVSNLDMSGVLNLGGLNATVETVNATSFNLSSANSFAQMPQMRIDFNLPKASLVQFNFNLGMYGAGYHIVLQMRVDGSTKIKSIVGNTVYWGSSMTYSQELSAGDHYVQIYYRTPHAASLNANDDYSSVVLQVINYGGS